MLCKHAKNRYRSYRCNRWSKTGHFPVPVSESVPDTPTLA